MVDLQPLSFLSSGRFDLDGLLLPGAWLAVYTPLDGAVLLTTQPPQGFIGLAQSDLSSTLEPACCRLVCANLAGIDLQVDLVSSWNALQPARQGILLPPLTITLKAHNRTRNPLPISAAFSWQDLRKEQPQPCLLIPQGLTTSLGDGTRLSLNCAQARTHFSYCLGWNPGGSLEEIWDDFFASGELGSQQYDSLVRPLAQRSGFASALCAHCLSAPLANVEFHFLLQNNAAV